MEDESLHASSENDLTRREFVAVTLGAGIAMGIRPALSQTITTDVAGLEAGDVKIPVGGEEMPGYRAAPKSGGPFPTVLVVEEIFGVTDHIKDVCRRFAKLGYLAVAPELFARQGDPGGMSDINEIISKVVSKASDAQVLSDLDAAAAWAAKNRGDAGKLGITGFCWGGRITWLYSAHNPNLKAGVAWYGGLTGKPSELQPKHPIDLVAEMKAPVLGLYGGQDPMIPVASVDQMREAMKKAGKPTELIVYGEAPHGFNADYRPSYRKEAAEDGWKRMLAWFKKYGVS